MNRILPEGVVWDCIGPWRVIKCLEHLFCLLVERSFHEQKGPGIRRHKQGWICF